MGAHTVLTYCLPEYRLMQWLHSFHNWIVTVILKVLTFCLTIQWLLANFIPFILHAPLDHQTDRPTLIECIRFRGRERRINIPQEIGVKYYQFGLLLLENDSIRSIAHKHREDPERINIQVLEEWVAGRGKHPITWQTLTQLLCDIELWTLAAEIEAVKC